VRRKGALLDIVETLLGKGEKRLTFGRKHSDIVEMLLELGAALLG
jgi:hypothetical protein